MTNGWKLLEGGRAWLSLGDNEKRAGSERVPRSQWGTDSHWTCASSSGLLPSAQCREAALQIHRSILGLAVAF